MAFDVDWRVVPAAPLGAWGLRLNIGGVLLVGEASEPLCQMPVELNKIGMVLLGGLNPVAAAEEAGLEAESISESGTIDFRQLVSYHELWASG